MIIIYLKYPLQLYDVTFYISLLWVLIPQRFMMVVFKYIYMVQIQDYAAEINRIVR